MRVCARALGTGGCGRDLARARVQDTETRGTTDACSPPARCDASTFATYRGMRDIAHPLQQRLQSSAKAAIPSKTLARTRSMPVVPSSGGGRRAGCPAASAALARHAARCHAHRKQAGAVSFPHVHDCAPNMSDVGTSRGWPKRRTRRLHGPTLAHWQLAADTERVVRRDLDAISPALLSGSVAVAHRATCAI